MKSYPEFSATPNQQPPVLLVEGHPLLREALEHILRSQLGLERFEYADSGHAAVLRAADLEPWLVLIDLSLPDMNGLEAARRILDRAPDIHVILLIETPEAAYHEAAEASGISTCIAKTSLRGDLPKAVAGLLKHDAPNPATNNRAYECRQGANG
jgi:DNA-binding NarL/FixJ family response regulator